MTLFDSGSGPPIVVVTGVQGRWEWMRPALEALARHGRTIGYSLLGEPGSGGRLPRGATFDAHLAQLDRVMEKAGLERATLCGISFGGWIALRYAARRPQQTAGLVLVSAPGPGFRPTWLQQQYIRTPRLLLPAFAMTSRRRLGPEIRAALMDPRERRRFTRQQLLRVARAPMSPGRMGRRMRLAAREDFARDCAAVRAPTLVVTGEPGLDLVVPVASTLEYLALIRQATAERLVRSGHLGLVTRPESWAALVGTFARRVTGWPRK